jgi:hypothetical protein
LVLTLWQKPATANGGTAVTPPGWVLAGENLAQGGYGATLGADTGNTNIRVYTKTADGTETGTLTVTVGSNNVAVACIANYTTTSTGWAATTTAYTSVDITPSGGLYTAQTGTIDLAGGDMLHYVLGMATDSVPGSWDSLLELTCPTAYIAPGTDRNSFGTSTGNDLGGYSGSAMVGNGASAGEVTLSRQTTASLTNIRGPVIVLRIREAVPVAPATMNTARAVELTGAVTAPLAPATQRTAAVELVAAWQDPFIPPARVASYTVTATAGGTAAARAASYTVTTATNGAAPARAASYTVTVASATARPATNFFLWDGAQELPLTASLWDGAQEVGLVYSGTVGG